jgi:hypothetical protein
VNYIGVTEFSLRIVVIPLRGSMRIQTIRDLSIFQIDHFLPSAAWTHAFQCKQGSVMLCVLPYRRLVRCDIDLQTLIFRCEIIMPLQVQFTVIHMVNGRWEV